MLKNRWIAMILIVMIFPALSACDRSTDPKKKSFLQIGAFSVTRVNDTLTLVRDGAGRTLALVPRGAPAPEGYAPTMIIRTPVRRVVAYSAFDVATLNVLGVLEDTLVGVTQPVDKWYVDSVIRGMKSGKIAWIGYPNAIDFELLKKQRPELVLTWDPSIIPMCDELGIACVITTTPVAMCLSARMSFVKFLAPFFGREKEADAYFSRISAALSDIRNRTASAFEKPKVMWGDIYEKRVLVEPGNAWIGELVTIVNGGYLFKDIYGTSCIEISLERFLYSGKDADIYFTYRTPETGATSKQALARMNPIIAGIKPLGPGGRVYAPLPIYAQSGDKLDEIFLELAAIIHPDLYPGYELRYFQPLPDRDPVQKNSRQAHTERRAATKAAQGHTNAEKGAAR